ncbi:MAG TPA: glycosyltransferase family 39 protein [Thermomicrobiales bacterium]|nr:glycosyltransferase family 39 protein [Thermomicrobiales bacterium]
MATRSAGDRRGNSADQSTRVFTGRRKRSPSSSLLASGWMLPALIWTVHLVVVQTVASLSYAFGNLHPASPPSQHPQVPLDGWVGKIVNPMMLWDGLWYRMIADEGYAGWTPKAAFWPMFPWMMRAVHDVTGISYDTAGYIIANLCFLIALILLYQLVRIDFDDRVAAGTLIALAVFPTSFFFRVVYTESPFLMFCVAALLCARTQRWWWAGVLGALAALTRSYGMFLILPFAVLYWEQYGRNLSRKIPTTFPAIAMPLLGPAIFSWRLHVIHGDWLLWKHVQEQWARYSAKPWDTIYWAFQERSPENAAHAARNPGLGGDGAEWGWLHQLWNQHSWALVSSERWRWDVGNSDTLELVCTLLFIGLAIVGLRILPLYMSAFTIPALVVPLFQPSYVHTLMSMPRFGLTMFPLFIVLAVLVARSRLTWPLAIVSTGLLIIFTMQFTAWYWVS